MSENTEQLAVTLTVDQLGALIAARVRAELAQLAALGAPEVLDLEDAAKLLKRHTKVVTKLVKTRGLPCHFISDREPRFKRFEILAWLDTLPTMPGKAT